MHDFRNNYRQNIMHTLSVDESFNINVHIIYMNQSSSSFKIININSNNNYACGIGFS